MNKFLPILVLLTFVSCRQKPSNDYEKAIIGEWKFVKEEAMNQTDDIQPHWRNVASGYDFLPDNICDNKLGYFKIIEGDEVLDRKFLFLGTKTKYKIEQDTLKIYNLEYRTWISKKIINITENTMTLQENDSTFLQYTKTNYQIDQNEHYDEIIISTSGCFGFCPINDISINKDGQITYFGDEYNTMNGYFKSKVSSQVFLTIENDFKKANIKKLKDFYSSGIPDTETVYVTFIKDKKIVKTITDHDRQSPTEFIWAYTSARYLYQQISLDTLSHRLNYAPFKYTTINKDGTHYELLKSEGFYLWMLLSSSNLTNKTFTKKYYIAKIWERGERKQVRTDGQFFRFIGNDGIEKVYDLGFNFITTNEDVFLITSQQK